MSGHSKWSQIKRKKGIADQKRGQIFSKLSRLITLSVKEGGGITDPANNVKLRLAIERAKAENMPHENVKRAIEKAVSSDASGLKEIIYEAFAPKGVQMIIKGLSDNPNRTHSEVKNLIERLGGKLGTPNSVAHLFKLCGVVVFDKSKNDETAIFAFADKLASFDIEEDDQDFVVYIPFEQIGAVHDNLGQLQAENIEVFYRPEISVELDQAAVVVIDNIIEKLEDLEDVDKVYANYTTR
ncbi:hypothetical protein A3J15_03510 [Candidatus Roizmanbacteria bacterium RIFCSPLOWO2_02_FULL_38_10]|uniref:Probable transcriptional regulatory protein A3J15_03510 n=1 Tax=Candidatus Roizmanbacteria bacterium RIFCSPLOWO2_02_FULL_38_10 TaxID=1802074 RepID=A0A1F7JKW9_9BACT|nr:MAG: hypothetical protein A3J15_03510 [Candidatus Roizmanbacteria bacterium RIFCSPLOWO2_02_FULL_38_10]